MATHTFSDHQIRLDKRYVLLGPDWTVLGPKQRLGIARKISGESLRKTKFVWATLGWAEKDREFNPTGNLRFSTRGQDQGARGVTREEITTIYKFNGLLGSEVGVRERYINFDEVDFGFQPDSFELEDIPKLRLTLFLNKGEGAIVYYQHSFRNDYHDEDAEVVYINPEPTAGYSSDRDRLDYLFPILPGLFSPDPIEPDKLSLLNEEPDSSFIIKVLTYSRNRKDAPALFREGIRQLNRNTGTEERVGSKKYKIWKYDTTSDEFQVVNKKSEIEWKAKTLILVHGTFSTIRGTYRDLIWQQDGILFKSMLEDGVFEQVLGFDHPTISQDVFDNARWLYDYMGSKSFSKPVYLLGTSRGGLLTRWLASDPANRHFSVAEVLNFSAANGVDYFTVGKHIGILLSILRRAGGPGAQVITLLAQFSVNYFLDQPGCQNMTPGNDRLNTLLETHPEGLRYKGVAADWNKSLEPTFYKRLLSVMVEAVTSALLGRENDWVVSTANQKISPPGSLPACTISSMHTRNYEPGFARKNSEMFDSHSYIYSYFAGQSLPC